ncbi:hypothetical protein SUNI508_11498 [Seiridium unicorne]|uniref:Uncharacterized protein n=1 Tax=Seiridium unicorne TaxID=138068 RepID=A0ABR2UHA9_9PEZI
MFATSPKDFAQSGSLVSTFGELEPSIVTKLGVSMTVPLDKEVNYYRKLSHLHRGNLANPLTTYRAQLNYGSVEASYVFLRLVPVERKVHPGHESGRSWSYYRLPLTQLEFSASLTTPANIFIARRIQPDIEQLPFGSGGIYFQQLSFASSTLFGQSCRGPPDSIDDTIVTDIRFCKPPQDSPAMSLTELKVLIPYACCLFIQPDLGQYSPPIKIEFCITKFKERPILYLHIGYSQQRLYLSIMDGQLPSVDNYYRDKEMFSTDSVTYESEYGPVAHERKQVSPKFEIIAVIHREDPWTPAGVAAGSRSHFILFLVLVPIKGQPEKSIERSAPRATPLSSNDPESSTNHKAKKSRRRLGFRRGEH